ncbi:MAG: hypothetical protein JETT_3947 [Candidatus Jettenia ecosi]|uniref:Uncharacterized protein n=1 Tax=Candidatus Jettenia ecosi TaxID=2494326 RepID=A0A533Q5I5_9BACT|nr:MAG: hypothetical protein JETT_3947 [Candidatus Jettenia ecosi]
MSFPNAFIGNPSGGRKQIPTCVGMTKNTGEWRKTREDDTRRGQIQSLFKTYRESVSIPPQKLLTSDDPIFW